MDNATLKQARKVLALIAESERSAAWIQDGLIGSGAFADMLAVDNLAHMNRSRRREFFGLVPLVPPPPPLEEIGSDNRTRALSITPITMDRVSILSHTFLSLNTPIKIMKKAKRWKKVIRPVVLS